MPTQLTSEVATAINLQRELNNRSLRFERCQAALKNRYQQIIQGTLSLRRRRPLRELLAEREDARVSLRAFMSNLTEEEGGIIAIARGPGWRRSKELTISSFNDPAFP